MQGADLSNAQLVQTQLDQADLTGATLTGACIEDWNVNASTKLANVTCDYVYLKSNQQERRPSQGTFQPGEFAALFQQAVNTVDLIFKDGIDWQAFFQSFQDLRSQYADQDLSIQAIEKKRGGAFVVRLEVPPEVDKAVVEEKAKALYGEQLKQMESRYQQLLQLQGQQLDDYRDQAQDLKQENNQLIGIVKTMANKEATVIQQVINGSGNQVVGSNTGNLSINQNISDSSNDQSD